jgi:hypothetical protein
MAMLTPEPGDLIKQNSPEPVRLVPGGERQELSDNNLPELSSFAPRKNGLSPSERQYLARDEFLTQTIPAPRARCRRYGNACAAA